MEKPPKEISEAYVEKERYKDSMQWWAAQAKDLQEQINKLKKENIGQAKKIHKLRKRLKDKDFELLKWQHEWRDSIWFKVFKFLHRVHT